MVFSVYRSLRFCGLLRVSLTEVLCSRKRKKKKRLLSCLVCALFFFLFFFLLLFLLDKTSFEKTSPFKVTVTFLKKFADTVPALAKAMIWLFNFFLLFYEIFKIQFGDYLCEVLDVQISFGN